MKRKKFKRILIKLSGEAISGESAYGINHEIIREMALDIKEIHELGIEVAMVIGGGNIFRGTIAEAAGMDRVTADYMGMLATIINGMGLQDALENEGVETRMLTAIDLRQIAEPFVRRRAIRHLEKRRVLIFGGGTGNPYFSTDSAAALRAVEVNADVIIKATKVDGVYNADPKKVKGAVRFDELDYMEVLKNDLKVMDSTAIALCKDNGISIIVCNMMKGCLRKVVSGQKIGTIVRSIN